MDSYCHERMTPRDMANFFIDSIRCYKLPRFTGEGAVYKFEIIPDNDNNHLTVILFNKVYKAPVAKMEADTSLADIFFEKDRDVECLIDILECLFKHSCLDQSEIDGLITCINSQHSTRRIPITGCYYPCQRKWDLTSLANISEFDDNILIEGINYDLPYPLRVTLACRNCDITFGGLLKILIS